MSEVWTTQKGDEWRYEGNDVQASADLDSQKSLLSIRHIRSISGALTHTQLLQLLRDTKKCFSEAKINLKISSSETELSSTIKLLISKGLVKTHEKEHQGNTIFHIVAITNKKRWSLW